MKTKVARGRVIPSVTEVIKSVKEAFLKWLEARREFRFKISEEKEKKVVRLALANQRNRKLTEVQMNEFMRFVMQMQERFGVVPLFTEGANEIVMCDLKIA